VGDTETSEWNHLSKPLFLDAFNLDNDSILNDHTDFTKADAANSGANVIQVELARWGRVGDALIEIG
jgi:hypothetical protein